MTTKTAEEQTLVVRGSVLPLSERARDKWDQDSLDLLAATKAKGADVGTMLVLAETSARYELDPWANEIWCARMGGQDGSAGSLAIMVGRDGYMKIAKRDRNFVSCAGQAVYENDELDVEIDETGGLSKFRFKAAHPAKRGAPQGAFAILKRDDKPSLYFFAPLSQFKKGGGAWKYEDAMIVKCAQSYLLRTTYNVSGPAPADEIMVGFDPSTDVESTATEEPLDLPEEIGALFARASAIDPLSWPRNEVEARIFQPDGTPDPNGVRKVRVELEAWLEENAPAEGETPAPDLAEVDESEPVDADVVEDEAPAPVDEPPQETTGPSEDVTPPSVEEPADAPAEEPAEEPAPDSPELDGLRARGRDLMDRLNAAPQGTREQEELDEELEQVEGRIRELGGQEPGQDALDV